MRAGLAESVNINCAGARQEGTRLVSRALLCCGGGLAGSWSVPCLGARAGFEGLARGGQQVGVHDCCCAPDASANANLRLHAHLRSGTST